MIIRNAIRCNICGDEIESKHRHDFVTCKCGAYSVDGGHDYLRRCFKTEGCYIDISLTDHGRKRIESVYLFLLADQAPSITEGALLCNQ